MTKLTNRQKTQIIAEYATEKVSQRELAERYGVSQKTISKILNSDGVPETVSNIKTENLLSMAAYVKDKREVAQKIVSLALENLEVKINGASIKETCIAIDTIMRAFADPKNSAENGENGAGKAVVEFVFKDCSLSEEGNDSNGK